MANRDNESAGRQEDYGRYGQGGQDRAGRQAFGGRPDEGRSWSGAGARQSQGQGEGGYAEGGFGQGGAYYPMADRDGGRQGFAARPYESQGAWDRDVRYGQHDQARRSQGSPSGQGAWDQGNYGRQRNSGGRYGDQQDRGFGENEEQYSSYSAGNPQEDRGGGFDQESWNRGNQWGRDGQASRGQGGGSYGQGDYSPAAQRSHWRENQRPDSNAQPYGQGQSGDGRQSARFGQAEGGEHEFESGYRQWREQQLNSHDQDYSRWRDEQSRRYDDDYRSWRTQRHDAFSRDFHDWRSRQSAGGDNIASGGAHASGSGGAPVTSSGPASTGSGANTTSAGAGTGASASHAPGGGKSSGIQSNAGLASDGDGSAEVRKTTDGE